MKAAAHFSLSCLLLVGFVSTPALQEANAQTQRGQVPRGQAQRAQTKRPAPQAASARPTTSARPSAPGTAVAVVDISAIFENHSGFKASMDRMKQEVQQFEELLRSRHQSLAKERDQLMQFNPGTPEYEKLERSMADKAAKLQVDAQLKKKEFLQRESKVYYRVYQEVSAAVRQFADMKGIDLVLRYNGGEMNPDDRVSVLQGVNRPMVYHRNLDITREILDRLNRAPRVSRTSGRSPARTGR